MTQNELKQITKKIMQSYQVATLPSVPAVFYLVALVLGLNKAEALTTVKYVIPPALLVLSAIMPQVVSLAIVRSAFDERLKDQPELRLQRMLEVPRRIELMNLLGSIGGVAWIATWCSILFKKSIWIIPWSMFVISVVVLILGVQIRMAVDKILQPYIVAEFRRLQQFKLGGKGFFWPRQKWYLPYLFGLYVVCTMTILLTVIGRTAYDTFTSFSAQTERMQPTQFIGAFQEMVRQMMGQLMLPLLLLGLYLIIIAAISAWQLARYHSHGTQAVQDSIEGLASGKPRLPEWMGTDEIGDLALSTAKILVHLKDFSLSLGESANSLAQSAQTLGLSTTQQGEMLTRQATAMQETQVTAQEIKQTSDMAQKKTEVVLKQTEQADLIGRKADEAVERVLGGLQETRGQVLQMAQTIRHLGERAKQIGRITATVKDLADQSNMLALNAAIEAVRSGDHGKGFGVVAREIRSLADQSIAATNHVRSILQDITGAISASVVMSEQGAVRVEEGLQQVREFSTSISELSSIVRESGASVRQISVAVSQQNAGIGEIFRAVSEMSKLMEESMARMKATDEAMVLVQEVASKVNQFVDRYGWQQFNAASHQKLVEETRGQSNASSVN